MFFETLHERLAETPKSEFPDDVVQGARRAAVLVALYPRDGDLTTLLVERTRELPNHAGQIAFPGGKPEPGDTDLQATALRETAEEVGISPESVTVLGPLPEVFTMTTNFLIQPFVGRLDSIGPLRPDPTEVAEILEIPIRSLRNPDAHWEERRGRSGHLWPFYRFDGKIIWGATGAILRSLLAVLPDSGSGG